MTTKKVPAKKTVKKTAKKATTPKKAASKKPSVKKATKQSGTDLKKVAKVVKAIKAATAPKKPRVSPPVDVELLADTGEVNYVAPKKATAEDLLNPDQRKWWDDIKGHRLDLFGLPEQYIGAFASPLNLDSKALYLTVKAPAAVPAIEEFVAGYTMVDRQTRVRVPKYTMKMSNKYIVIKPAKGSIQKVGNKMMFVADED